jgi:amidase
MPGNYNSLTGFGMNPYDPRRDPRPPFDGRPVMSPGGSSSGIGTSANFWAGNVGTETSGSILTPASLTMLVGIKPTVGRISRHGVIPITADQDTPGPMTKYVMDAAILLGAMESAPPDPNDPATRACTPPPGRDYTKLLRPGSLKGMRIGIPRAFYIDAVTLAGSTQPRGGANPFQSGFINQAIAALRREGAVIVDPADIPSIVDPNPAENFLLWGTCAGAQRRGADETCSVVLKYGMKRDFNKWLASLGPVAPVASLADLIAWNKAHERGGTLKYGQTLLEISDEMDVERDRARYETDRAKDLRVSATNGIDAIMKAERLDALLFAGANGSPIAAKAGYPSVTVPFAMSAPGNPPNLPAGFALKPQPIGITFTGMACSEPRLLQIAFGFEQATKKRVPPF